MKQVVYSENPSILYLHQYFLREHKRNNNLEIIYNQIDKDIENGVIKLYEHKDNYVVLPLHLNYFKFKTNSVYVIDRDNNMISEIFRFIKFDTKSDAVYFKLKLINS